MAPLDLPVLLFSGDIKSARFPYHNLTSSQQISTGRRRSSLIDSDCAHHISLDAALSLQDRRPISSCTVVPPILINPPTMSSPGSSTAASNQTKLSSSMPPSPANGTERNSAASGTLPKQTTNRKTSKAAEAQRLSDAKVQSWLDDREDHLIWYLSYGGLEAKA